ncbi:sortase family protein [Bifidobacterium saguini DSM 23967]|uniref:Sortase family protein n=2 Tax=Bifidobacterium saguini TaxID=762210 RepID=A0A087DBH8_9BIFI|nr:class C sortase [Bifidobacterium saguini]KFI92878.1 sortase family protein [Bifidobacterium saguini DSM 23967]QTB91867.1 class C sortase [Bifidobacterium saguini]
MAAAVASANSRDDKANTSRDKGSLLFSVLSVVFLLIGLAIITTPFVMRAINEYRQNNTVQQTQSEVASWPYPQAENKLKAARAYNQRLAASGQTTIGEVQDPFTSNAGQSTTSDADDSLAAKDSEYQSLLDADQGVMGSIRIPEIDVNLPIYHGTSDDALAAGAGHLYGTSLPVGGKSTHSVITGHRGLPGSLLFTRLDELRVGDSFYIDVMGETLGYKIDRITVIEPSDSSKLRITPGEDRVTLMTCTPYGVNSHRLLVSAVRAEIPNEVPAPDDVHGLNTTWLALGGIAAVVLVIIAVVLLRRRARTRKSRGNGLASSSQARHAARRM